MRDVHAENLRSLSGGFGILVGRIVTNAADHIESQAAEIARLRGIEREALALRNACTDPEAAAEMGGGLTWSLRAEAVANRLFKALDGSEGSASIWTRRAARAAAPRST